MEDEERSMAAATTAARPLIDNLNVDNGHQITFVLAISTLVAQCSSVSNGCAVAFTSPAASEIINDLSLSTSEYAIFGSIYTVGNMAGSLISGKTSDYIGRKKTFWLSQIFVILGWLGITMAKNAWCLYIERVSMGFGAGFTCYVVPIYTSEIAPKNIRGALVAISQLTAYLGIALMYIGGNYVSWRVLAIIGSIPGILQVVGLLCIPESPRWLAKIGRFREVEVTLQQLRGKYVDINVESETIRDYTTACKTVGEFSKTGIAELFRRKYAQALIVGVGLPVVQELGGANAIVTYVSEVFKAADFSTSIGGTGMSLIQIPVIILGICLMDVWGRRPLAMLSTTGLCLSCLLVGSSFLCQDFNLGKEITPIMVFIGLMLYNASFALGIGFIPRVIISEIFPVNVKGVAGSLVILVSSFCSMIITYTFPLALEWSSAGIFFMFFAVCCVGLLLVIKLVPETKCRSLEEIQGSIVHSQ